MDEQQAGSARGATMEGAPDILGALLVAVSHDLRNPLLTLRLGVDWLLEALPADDPGYAVARDTLPGGLADLERMLDGLTLVSRARRRALHIESLAVADLLAGHCIREPGTRVAGTVVAVDPLPVGDALELVGGGEPLDIEVTQTGERIMLACPLPPAFAHVEGAPFSIFTHSLKEYCGTPIAGLAAVQMQLERQSALVQLEGGRLTLCVPAVERAPQ